MFTDDDPATFATSKIDAPAANLHVIPKCLSEYQVMFRST
jgi:hypothetical protein